jgi:hypothetical protein
MCDGTEKGGGSDCLDRGGKVVVFQVIMCLVDVSNGIKHGVLDGTKSRWVVAMRAAFLPAKSQKSPNKRHIAQLLRRSNLLDLVPLHGVRGNPQKPHGQ